MTLLYPKESVVCDSVSFWETLTAEEGSITDSLIDDILQGLPLRLLARRYGRDYMRNYKAYIAFAQLVDAQEHGAVQAYQRYAEERDFRKLIKENPNCWLMDGAVVRAERGGALVLSDRLAYEKAKSSLHAWRVAR